MHVIYISYTAIKKLILIVTIKRVSLLIFIGLITAVTGYARADRDSLLLTSVDAMMHERFQEAETLMEQFVRKYPEDPVPVFFRGVLYWRQGSYMSGRRAFDAKSNDYWKKCIEICDSNLEEDADDSYSLFFKGGALGLIGTNKVMRKKYVRAGINAYKGIRNLQRAFELDPGYWDIYYGMGLYHVVAANTPGVVKFIQKILPIPTGDQDLGIEYLKISNEKGYFAPYMANSLLGFCFIYYDTNYDSAYFYLDDELSEYPENVSTIILALNLHAHESFNTGETDWTKFLHRIEMLENRVNQRKQRLKDYYWQKFRFFKGYCYFRLERYEEASLILNRFVLDYSDNELCGIAYLILGGIADLSWQRVHALTYYDKAAQYRNHGNLEHVLTQFNERPYSGESDIFYRGQYFDVPDRP